MLNFKLQIILFLTSFIGLIATLELIKKNMLEFKYAFLWLVIGCAAVLLSIFPESMGYLAKLTGIETPSNALYLVVLYFILCLIFSLTIIVSRNARRVRILNQEIAVLRSQLEELKK